MGSFGEHAKGQQPMLDRIRAHNDAYNKMIETAWLSVPWWKRAMYRFGVWWVNRSR